MNTTNNLVAQDLAVKIDMERANYLLVRNIKTWDDFVKFRPMYNHFKTTAPIKNGSTYLIKKGGYTKKNGFAIKYIKPYIIDGKMLPFATCHEIVYDDDPFVYYRTFDTKRESVETARERARLLRKKKALYVEKSPDSSPTCSGEVINQFERNGVSMISFTSQCKTLCVDTVTDPIMQQPLLPSKMLEQTIPAQRPFYYGPHAQDICPPDFNLMQKLTWIQNTMCSKMTNRRILLNIASPQDGYSSDWVNSKVLDEHFPSLQFEINSIRKMIIETCGMYHSLVGLFYEPQGATYKILTDSRAWGFNHTAQQKTDYIRRYLQTLLPQQRFLVDIEFNIEPSVRDVWKSNWRERFPGIIRFIEQIEQTYEDENLLDYTPKLYYLEYEPQSSREIVSDFEQYLELLRGVGTKGNGRPQLPKGTRLSRELAAYHFHSIQEWERIKREVHENRWCKLMMNWNEKKLFDKCSTGNRKKKQKNVTRKLKRMFRNYEPQGWREVYKSVTDAISGKVTRMAASIAANVCHKKLHAGLDFMISEFTSNFKKASNIKSYLVKLYCALCLAMDYINRPEPDAAKHLMFIAHMFFDNMCTFAGATLFAGTDILGFVFEPILAFVRQLSQQMRRKTTSTNDPVTQNFQSQSDTNVFSNFATVFNYAFFGKDMPDSKAEKRLKAISTLGHAITGTQTLFRFLYSCFEFVGRRIFKEYLGIDLFPNEANELRKDIQRAEEMLLEISNHMTLKPNDKERARTYLEVIQKDFASIETRVNDINKSQFTSAFMSFRRQYMQLYQRLDASVKTKTSRTHPVASLHLGMTGSGKTSAGWWLTRLLMDPEDPVRTDDNIYYRNRQAAFWDGYAQQKVVIFDELFQSKDQTRIGLESEEIFGMLNNARYNLNMAALERKADTAFTSRYVFFTSNFADPEIIKLKPRIPNYLNLPPDVAKQVTSIDALGSRFRDQVYMVQRKVGSTSKRMDTFDSNDINHPELKEALMDWEFFRYRYEPKTETGGPNVSGQFRLFVDSTGRPIKYDIFEVASLLRQANEMYEKSDIAELTSRVELDKLCPPHCSVIGGVIRVNREEFVSQAGGTEEEAKEEEGLDENIREQTVVEDGDLLHQLFPYVWKKREENGEEKEVVETTPVIIAFITDGTGKEIYELLTPEEFTCYNKQAMHRMLYVDAKSRVFAYDFKLCLSSEWAELLAIFDIIFAGQNPLDIEYRVKVDQATSAFMDATLKDDSIPIWKKLQTFAERCLVITINGFVGSCNANLTLGALISARVISWMFGMSFLGYFKRNFVATMLMIMIRETATKFEFSLSSAYDSVVSKYKSLPTWQKGIVAGIGVGVVGVGLYKAYQYLRAGDVTIYEEQSKQYPDSNQPTKLAASNRRGPLAKDIKVAKFVSQSGFCKQFEDQKPKINQFVPIGVQEGTDIRTVHALNIGDKHLLFQAHVFSQLFSQPDKIRTELSARTFLLLPNEHYTDIVRIPVSDLEGKLAVDEARDFALLDCKTFPNIALTPKIWHRFIREDEVKRIRFNSETKLIVPGIRMESINQKAVIRGDNSLEIRDVHFSKATAYYGNTGPDESKEYCFTDGIVYNGACTELGDCGSLYMINDKTAPHKYIGLHTGGVLKTPIGICGMVTYEYIEKLLGALHGQEYKPTPIGNAFDDLNPDGYDGNDPIVKVITSQNAIGSVTLLGHVPFVTNTENDIVPSELAKTNYSPEPDWEPKTGPAVLKPIEVDGVKVSPFAEGLKKLYKKPKKMPTEREVEDACSRIHLQYKPKGIDGYVPKVLTLGEAINGTKTDYLTGLKMKTSPGYPFVQGKYQDFGNKGEKGKLRFFKNIRTTQDPMYVPISENGTNPFMEEYARLVNLYAQGGVYGVRYIDCLKVERRPKEKLRKASTRIFSTANMSYIVICKQLCGMVCAIMAEQHNFAESKVGINPHSDEWKIMHDFMRMYDRVIAGDFSAFDGSIIAALLRAIPQVFKNWFNTYAIGTEFEEKYKMSLAKMVNQWQTLFDFQIPKEYIITEREFPATPEGLLEAVDLVKLHMTMIDSTCHDMIVTIRIANGVVYLVIGSMPSGHPYTTFGNNIVNGTATRICFIRAGLGTVEDFDMQVRSAYTGDDNVHSTNNEKFTMRVLVEKMGELGLTYTDFRKTDEITDFHTWDIVTFLKRAFRREGTKVFAPLDKNVIFEMPYWIHKQGDPIEATVVNATNALRECVHHGREFYADFQQHLRKCFLTSKGQGGLGLTEEQIGQINWSYSRFLAEIESGTFRYSSEF